MAATLALPLALFAYAAWLTSVETKSAADREIARTLDVAHEHALKVFETIELSLAQTEEAVRGLTDDDIRAGQDRIHRRLKRLADALPQIKSLWLFDRSGRALVNSIGPLPPDIDFSDRDYFRAHVDNPAVSPFIGKVLEPRPPLDGASFFGVSRRRSAPDFEGVVQASVLPDYFEAFYQRMAQHDDMFFALGLSNGNILARHPASGQAIQVSPKHAAAKEIARNPAAGLVTTTIPSDGVQRRMAYKRLDAYPVYIATGMSTSAISRRWQSTMTSYLAIGAPLTAGVFALLWLALRRTEQLHVEAAHRQAAEEHLRRGQRLEALGHLTSGVAHDFNNLLTVIGSSADMLRRQGLSADRQQRYADAISETVQRATVLTGRLLTFARSQPSTTSEFDVNACLESIAAMLRILCGPGITVSSVPSDGPALVRADRSQFETAMVNLAANARDAMAGVGQLAITVSALDEDDTLSPASSDIKRHVRIAVRDTGTGISPEDVGRVFEPFFTTKDVGQGTGLGLSQVLGFARQAGGDVTVESQPGEGSTFMLSLPRSS